MKKTLFLALAATCMLTVARADDFTDFGEDYGMWKGDFAAGDIDNDGDQDLIFSGEENGREKGGILLNDGNGNFTPQEGDRIFKLGQAGNIQFGDIDGDGDLDIIFTGWGSGSTADSRGIALNDGNGVYTLANQTQYPILQANKITSCGFADFNVDGLLDYYFFGNYVRTNVVDDEFLITGNCVIYFQLADGSFVADANAFPTHRFNEPEVTIVDFDNDGYPDIWVNAANDANECDNDTQTGESLRFSALFKNDGFGQFTEFNFGANGLTYDKSNGTSSWADVDGDGYMDLLHNGDGYLCSGETSDRPNRVYKNLNGIGLQEKFMMEVARVGHFGNGTTWVDWNGDGKLDFISGGWDESVGRQVTYLYLGVDPVNFTFSKGDLGSVPGVSEQGYRIADLNDDRKPDLLQNGFGSIGRRVTGWVKNTTSPAMATLEAPTSLNVAEDPDDDTRTIFSWGIPASLQGKPGITYNLSLRNVTTGKWFYNPMAVVGGDKNGWRKIGGRSGNVYANKEYSLYELPDGVYEWTVQAIDGSYFGGAFASTETFIIGTTGVKTVNVYRPEVFLSAGNLLKVVGVQGVEQTLKVYNVSGILLNTTSFISNTELKMPNAGIYIVELSNKDGDSHKTKIVVQ